MNKERSSDRGGKSRSARTERNTSSKSNRSERDSAPRSARSERTSASGTGRPERRSSAPGNARPAGKPERGSSFSNSGRPERSSASGTGKPERRSSASGNARLTGKPERGGSFSSRTERSSVSKSGRPERSGDTGKGRPERGVASASGRPTGKRVGKSRVAPVEEPKREFAPKKFEKRTYSKGKFDASRGKKMPGKTLESDGMRLNRFIANAGVCSRREADTFIAAGVVTINGKQITELGTRVMPGDEVRFDGRLLSAERKVYLLLNKPKDFVTTTDDPHAERTVMDLIKNACDERIYPVGRLDRNTTGLLLFTNDGDLSKRLTHPSHNMKKIYQVSLDKALTKADLEKIAEGFELEDGMIAADAISYIDSEDKTEIGIEIHSGRNRVVRRIFEHLGYRVKKLDRVFFAGLTKKNLPRGKFRFLSEKEVKFLKMI